MQGKFKINKYFILALLVFIIAGFYKDMLLLFLFVILHELCHVLAAYLCGVKIKNIEIFPFGGVARIDDLDYIGICKEIIITMAGPLFNIALAVVLFMLYKAGAMAKMPVDMININLMIALFNLFPGLPLDGGKIFRAVLSLRIGFKKATNIAAYSGKIISVIIFIFGIYEIFRGVFNIWLLIVPFFLFILANNEKNMVMFMIIKNLLNKKKHLKTKGMMETMVMCAHENTSISDILKSFDVDKYHIVIVLGEDMNIKAVLTESQIFNNLTMEDKGFTIGDISEKIK
ncbi:MAG: M50 family metallopeptidase [Clostridiales bacterium]|nr:M50 family metallopeptidase [Clostridiales bacterium]HBM80562.1 hypothetical protein [Clostridiaceae bacterium]